MRPVVAEISIDNLISNMKVLKSLSTEAFIYAVVKADAYGHGAKRISLELEQFVDGFCVASIDEALELRSVGIRKKVMLLEGVFSLEEISIAIDNELSLVLHSNYQLDWLQQVQQRRHLDVWLKVDTGLGRLGFFIDELDGVIRKVEKLDLKFGLLTHLSTADCKHDSYFEFQLDGINRFNSKGTLPHSFANSAAHLYHKKEGTHIVRAGLALYGIEPSLSISQQTLKPVMSFKSQIISIKTFCKGMYIGYGKQYRTSKDSLIAIIAAGYADGYPRSVASDAVVFVNGKYAPVRGVVSMDMIAIDVTGIDVNVGDSVELWGENIQVQRVAKWANTIGYELLTKVTARVPRVYNKSS